MTGLKRVTKTDLFGNTYQEVVEYDESEATQYIKSHTNPFKEDEPYNEEEID